MNRAIASGPGRDSTIVELTAAEKQVREAEEQEFLGTKAQREWEAKIKETDALMPRVVEDLIDDLNKITPIVDNLSDRLLEAYNQKKEIRAERPVKK